MLTWTSKQYMSESPDWLHWCWPLTRSVSVVFKWLSDGLVFQIKNSSNRQRRWPLGGRLGSLMGALLFPLNGLGGGRTKSPSDSAWIAAGLLCLICWFVDFAVLSKPLKPLKQDHEHSLLCDWKGDINAAAAYQESWEKVPLWICSDFLGCLTLMFFWSLILCKFLPKARAGRYKELQGNVGKMQKAMSTMASQLMEARHCYSTIWHSSH